MTTWEAAIRTSHVGRQISGCVIGRDHLMTRHDVSLSVRSHITHLTFKLHHDVKRAFNKYLPFVHPSPLHSLRTN